MSRLDELRFISRIAQRYYEDGERQSSIARDLSLSQATVSRMLKRAQDEGIVRFSLSPPHGTYPELEQALREKYVISEAIVVDCTEERSGAIMARIGEAAAHFLETTLQSDEVIGVSSHSVMCLGFLLFGRSALSVGAFVTGLLARATGAGALPVSKRRASCLGSIRLVARYTVSYSLL